MKQNLLFCAALVAASSLWAAPAKVTISGDGVAETAPVECTQVSDNFFEAFVQLNAGHAVTVKDGEGTVYNFSGNQVDKDGVYCVSLNFGSNSMAAAEVTAFNVYWGWSKLTYPIEYIGEGQWKGKFTSPNGDDRYRFVATIAGQEVHYVPANNIDFPPSHYPELGDAYFNMKVATNYDQWGPAWKWETSQKGKELEVTVTMRGTYTHEYTKPAPPMALTISGEALNEDAPAAMTQTGDNEYQAFAQLNEGKTLTVKNAEGKEYGTATPGSNGVYQIIVNTADNNINLKKITYFALKHCWTNTEFPLNYAGNGTYAGAFNWSKLDNQDNRYRFVFRYVRDDDNNYVVGPSNGGNDSEPNGSEDYYYANVYGKVSDQWNPKWKMANQYRDGNNHVAVVTLRGTFTHTFAEIGEVPAALTAGGSALAEGSSIAFNKINDWTYELFTKLKSGDLTISDGNNSYVIANGKFAKEAGATAIDNNGIYCINLCFASGTATIKEVNSIKFYPLGKFGPSGDALKYIGNGEWVGSLDIPADENIQFNPNDYRIEMLLDNEIQHWGNAGDMKLKRVPWTFWGSAFNFGKAIKGEKFNLRANFGAPEYVHAIEAYDPSAGVESVIVDENAPVEYYNLQGMRVENPANGLYIRRQGNKATKVLVK